MSKKEIEKVERFGEPLVTMLPVDKIVRNPNNPRKVSEKDPTIKELAESIDGTRGLIQAIVVRKHPKKEGFYELLAGERRTVAARVAGFIELKAEIVNVDDETANSIMVVENLQRKDLTPLEEAANLGLLLNKSSDKKEIAARIGRPLSWVVRRERLCMLIPAWTKHINKSLPGWGVGHMELIARYDRAIQRELLEACMLDWDWPDEWPRDDLERTLDDYFRQLKSAPWKLTNPLLYPKAGACAICEKRSCRQPGLFHDEIDTAKMEQQSRCLDPACWDKKQEIYLNGRVAKLQEKYPDLLKIANQAALPDEMKAEGCLPSHGYDFAPNKSHKKAMPAVVVIGNNVGGLHWIIPRSTGSSRSNVGSMGTGKLTMPEKKKRLQGRRDALIIDTVRADLEEKGEAILDLHKDNGALMIALAAVFGTNGTTRVIETGRWNLLDRLRKDPRRGMECLWNNGMVRSLAGELHYYDKTSASKHIDTAEQICKLVGFKFNEYQKMAEKKIPVPKSWAKEQSKKPAPKKTTKKKK